MVGIERPEAGVILLTLASDLVLVDRALAVLNEYFIEAGVEDTFELDLVCRELLNNAVVHGSRGRIDRNVFCRVSRPAPDFFRIAVADEGPGFDHAAMDIRLPEDPLTDRHRGLGLVKAFSKCIRFNAAGNRATADVAIHKTGPRRAAPVAAKGKKVEDKAIKILVVEDADVTRRMIMKMLRDLGYREVTGAADGREALAVLKRKEPADLILSDWNMPGMDGMELLRRLRRDPALRHIPFIMATAHGERRQAEHARSEGVAAFITKPFSPEELADAIASALGATAGDTAGKTTGESAGAGPAGDTAGRTTGESAGAGPDPGTVTEDDAGKPLLRAVHLQITDHLALAVARHLAHQRPPRHFRLETRLETSWNPVRDALASGEAEVAFIMAPIAMDLFASGVDIRAVLFAHRNGSACALKPAGGNRPPPALIERFRNRSVFIPHSLSIHHMFMHMTMREMGLSPGLAGAEGVDAFFEVAPPVMMPRFLNESESAAAFMVAEPIAANAVAAGLAEPFFHSPDLWEHHPCCLVCVRADCIAAHPAAVLELVHLLARAGRLIADHPGEAARIGLSFLDPDGALGWDEGVMRTVIEGPGGVRTDDLYPAAEDLDRIQHYMAGEMGVGAIIDLNRFIETRFAAAACERSVIRPSVFKGPAAALARWKGDGLSAPETESLETEASETETPETETSKTETSKTETSKTETPKTETPKTETPKTETPETQTAPAAGGAPIFQVIEDADTIRLTLRSRLDLIHRAIRVALEFSSGFAPEPFPEMETVLDALLRNAVTHGAGGRTDRTLQCAVTAMGREMFRIEVTDPGASFDPDRIAALAGPAPPEGWKDGESAGDWTGTAGGLRRISALCEHIDFNDRGNQITVLLRYPRRTRYAITESPDGLVVRPSGPLSAATIPELKGQLMDRVAEGHDRFRFDFERVTEIDSISLTLFVVLIKTLEQAGRKAVLEIVNADENIANLFRMTRLDRHYRLL